MPQVYGYLLCPVTYRVLVQDDDGVFNLPGGTPEPEDADLVATLAAARVARARWRLPVDSPSAPGYVD